MKILCVIFILLAICLSCAEVNAIEWVHYATDTVDNQFFYLRESVNFISKDIVHVYSKCNYSEMGLKERMEGDESYRNVSHDMCQIEINCSKKLYDVTACSLYDKSGKFLDGYSETNEQRKWEVIYDDSRVGSLRKAVCKLQPKETKKKK